MEAVDANGSKETESVQVTEKGKPQPLHVSVTEKIIFCIDATIFSNCVDDDKTCDEIFEILLLYMKMKKKISTKPAEFQCLLCSQDKVSLVEVHEGKDLRDALKSLKGEESQEFDLGVIFTRLAQTVELPHPDLCSEMVPPPWVYHCVLLFAHNIYTPVMKDTNAFDFLVQNPFFACDTVYIYDDSIPDNNCEMIGLALYSMYDVLNGYFFAVSCKDIDKQYSIFAQLLGHPLIRPPQTKAKFNLNELMSLENIK